MIKSEKFKQNVQISLGKLEVLPQVVYNKSLLFKGVYFVGDATAIFSIHDQKDIEIHEVVQQVYDALKEKGYNPVNQLVGYILSEDPTYITTYKGARSLIRKVDRDDLLQAMLRSYLNV